MMRLVEGSGRPTTPYNTGVWRLFVTSDVKLVLASTTNTTYMTPTSTFSEQLATTVTISDATAPLRTRVTRSSTMSNEVLDVKRLSCKLTPVLVRVTRPWKTTLDSIVRDAASLNAGSQENVDVVVDAANVCSADHVQNTIKTMTEDRSNIILACTIHTNIITPHYSTALYLKQQPAMF